MKKRLFLSVMKVCSLLIALMMVFTGCFLTEEPETTETESETTKKSTSNNTVEVVDDQIRVLITSDMHHNTIQNWYGVDTDDRMQRWVDSILIEHEKSPIDLIIINGDTSLDYVGTKGTYDTKGISETKIFVDEYVSQLPDEIPVVILPGNHECYTNAMWKQITGNDRQCSIALKGNLFIFPDNFRETLGDDYAGYAAPESAVDVDFVKAQMALYPDHNVWLVSHYFNLNVETSGEFAKIVRDDRVKGLFVGHAHITEIETLSTEYGGKKMVNCGNFSYSGDESSEEALKNSFWGHRELVIGKDFAISNYIVVETHIKIGNESFDVPYKKVKQVRFY